MAEIEAVYNIPSDGHGDLKYTTVEAIGAQPEWVRLAVSHQEGVSASEVHLHKYREVK